MDSFPSVRCSADLARMPDKRTLMPLGIHATVRAKLRIHDHRHLSTSSSASKILTQTWKPLRLSAAAQPIRLLMFFI